MSERDELIAGLRAMARYEHSDVTQAADAASLLERDGDELARLADKALRFSLDAAGIASRERDAVELVELRAALAAARRENDWLRAYTYTSNPT